MSLHLCEGQMLSIMLKQCIGIGDPQKQFIEFISNGTNFRYWHCTRCAWSPSVTCNSLSNCETQGSQFWKTMRSIKCHSSLLWSLLPKSELCSFPKKKMLVTCLHFKSNMLARIWETAAARNWQIDNLALQEPNWHKLSSVASLHRTCAFGLSDRPPCQKEYIVWDNHKYTGQYHYTHIYSLYHESSN